MSADAITEVVADRDAESIGRWHRVTADDPAWDPDLTSFDNELLAQWQDADDRVAVYVEEGEFSHGDNEGEPFYSAGASAVTSSRLFESKSLERRAEAIEDALDAAIDYLERTDPGVPFPAFTMRIEGGLIIPLADFVRRFGGSKARLTARDDGLHVEAMTFNRGVEFTIPRSDMDAYDVDREGAFAIGTDALWDRLDAFNFSDVIPISVGGDDDPPDLTIGPRSTSISYGFDYTERDTTLPADPDAEFTTDGLTFRDVTRGAEVIDADTGALGLLDGIGFLTVTSEDGEEEFTGRFDPTVASGEAVVSVDLDALRDFRIALPRPSQNDVSFTIHLDAPLLMETTVGDSGVDVLLVLADEAVPVDISVPPAEVTPNMAETTESESETPVDRVAREAVAEREAEPSGEIEVFAIKQTRGFAPEGRVKLTLEPTPASDEAARKIRSSVRDTFWGTDEDAPPELQLLARDLGREEPIATAQVRGDVVTDFDPTAGLNALGIITETGQQTENRIKRIGNEVEARNQFLAEGFAPKLLEWARDWFINAYDGPTGRVTEIPGIGGGRAGAFTNAGIRTITDVTVGLESDKPIALVEHAVSSMPTDVEEDIRNIAEQAWTLAIEPILYADRTEGALLELKTAPLEDAVDTLGSAARSPPLIKALREVAAEVPNADPDAMDDDAVQDLIAGDGPTPEDVVASLNLQGFDGATLQTILVTASRVERGELSLAPLPPEEADRIRRETTDADVIVRVVDAPDGGLRFEPEPADPDEDRIGRIIPEERVRRFVDDLRDQFTPEQFDAGDVVAEFTVAAGGVQQVDTSPGQALLEGGVETRTGPTGDEFEVVDEFRGEAIPEGPGDWRLFRATPDGDDIRLSWAFDGQGHSAQLHISPRAEGDLFGVQFNGQRSNNLGEHSFEGALNLARLVMDPLGFEGTVPTDALALYLDRIIGVASQGAQTLATRFGNFKAIRDLGERELGRTTRGEGVGTKSRDAIFAFEPLDALGERFDAAEEPPPPPEEPPAPEEDAEITVATVGGTPNYVISPPAPGAVEDEAIGAARDTLGPPGQFDTGATVGTVTYRGPELIRIGLGAGQELLDAAEEEPEAEPKPEEEPEAEPKPEEEPETPPEPAAEGRGIPEEAFLTRSQVETIVEGATLGVTAAAQVIGSTLREVKLRPVDDPPVAFTTDADRITVTAADGTPDTISKAVRRWAELTDLGSLTDAQVREVNEARTALNEQFGVGLPPLEVGPAAPEDEGTIAAGGLAPADIEAIVEGATAGLIATVDANPDIDSLRIELDPDPRSSVEYVGDLRDVTGSLGDPVTAINEALNEWEQAANLDTAPRLDVTREREQLEDTFDIDLLELGDQPPEETTEAGEQPDVGLEGVWAEARDMAIDQSIPLEDRQLRIGERLEPMLMEAYPDAFSDLFIRLSFPPGGTPKGSSVAEVMELELGGFLKPSGRSRFMIPPVVDKISAVGTVKDPEAVWDDALDLFALLDTENDETSDLTERYRTVRETSAFRIESGRADLGDIVLHPDEIRPIASRNVDLWQGFLTHMKDESGAWWAAQRVTECAEGLQPVCDLIEQEIAGNTPRGWADWYLEHAYEIFLDGDFDAARFIEAWHNVFEPGETEAEARARRGPVDLETLGRPAPDQPEPEAEPEPAEPTRPEPEPEPEPEPAEGALPIAVEDRNGGLGFVVRGAVPDDVRQSVRSTANAVFGGADNFRDGDVVGEAVVRDGELLDTDLSVGLDLLTSPNRVDSNPGNAADMDEEAAGVADDIRDRMGDD